MGEMQEKDYPYIDFHTHIIPSQYLKEVLQRKGSPSQERGRTISDHLEINYSGSIRGLLTSMTRSGIRYSVLLPVAKTPNKVGSTNDWVKNVTMKYQQLIPFGTIHPNYPHKERELDRLHQWGFKGVKMHLYLQSDHLHFRPSFLSHEFLTIARILEQLGMILFVDTYFPWDNGKDPLTVEGLIGLNDLFPNLKIVAAHMGSLLNWDAISLFYGRKIFLDIAYTLDILSNNIIESIINTHGADKVLFGSDFPYRTPEKEIERFLTLQISIEDKKCILYQNAKRLLDIQPQF